jgi:chitinase
MVGYWGQNSASIGNPIDLWEKNLANYCTDTTFDVIIVAFLFQLEHGNPGRPGLNFADKCSSAPFPGYPNLLQCSQIAADIKTCQTNGKKILLSIGGAVFSGQFSTETQASNYADLIWNMFLGGSDAQFQRPFFDAILDGIDLDIEGGSYIGWGSFARRLRTLYDSDPRKVYYLSGIALPSLTLL